MRDEPGCAKSSRAEPWKVDDAPADFVGMQMRAIVGVEITIRRIEGKWKMSQNRPLADREGVIAGFKETGEAGEVLAHLVQERAKDLK
jgi:transcriptional regulator